jgi:hypothetical protein
MYKKLIVLISVLVLSSVSSSYALVVGDFEGGLDGWAPAGDAVLTPSTVGATSGTGSLMIEGPGSWQMLALLDIKSLRSVLGVDGAAVSADVTAFAEDMQTDWMNMEMIINGQNNDDNGANNNIGWQSLGAVDIVRDGTTHTLTWELPADLSTKIAGTDDNIAWFELFIVTNNGATNTKIYVDNIQLLGAEPEPEPEEPGTKIIYVDATEGETGNTTLATGEVFTATGGNDGTDGLWRPRAFGNSATIFEANGATNGNPNDEIVPRLNTTVQVPENNYDVYVYFWADTSGWRIKAALENADPLPLFIANDPNGGATVALAEDFEEPVPMLTEGNRTLWQAYLGTTGVTTSISVYIDSDPRPAGDTSWNERTWYDGIGYKIASEVEPVPEEVVPVYPGTEGLVAHYAFENDTTDSSGNDLDGTIIGDANFADGVKGLALDLNGGGYVDCGGIAEFSFTDAMTISTWVNIRSVTTAWMTIAAKGENAWRLAVSNETTGLEYAFSGGTRGWQAATTATELAFDEWYHVAATYNTTGGATVYINEVQDASNPDTGGIDTNQFPLLIGENPEATGRLFDGMIDELMIYNRALSEGEILYLAGERPKPVDPGSDGLVAYYALENDANDSSGNGLDGTIVGDPMFVEGAIGMGLQLDGVDDYVDLGNDPLFDLTEQVTLSLWVNTQDIGTSQNNPWLGKGDTSYMIKGHRDGNQIEFFIYDGTWITAHADVGPEFNGEWHHAAGTYDGQQLIIYVDGEVAVTSDHVGGITPNTYDVAIGTNTQASGRFSESIIDEAIVYNRALSAGEIRYLAGFRSYTYDGDVLDAMWDHDNDSDAWDGTGIGEGNPGGASALVEDGVTFLRIQDTGDPRDYGISDPSNRKIYLTHPIDNGLAGAHLEFRIRVATSAPLDDLYPNGGAGIEPWPAGGVGFHIRDGGKGMIGIAEGGGTANPMQISFSLAKAGEPGFEDLTTDSLVMNGLGGTEANEDTVDTGDAGSIRNVLAIDDATAWNTVAVDIAPGGAGTHVVTVSVNGGPAESFDVTAGNRCDGDGNYIAIGSSGTDVDTAFDVDYITVSH